ncbi:MAG: NAD(P)/FAD-dependent oxidoreductase [Candidatus Riflebacteria bacterium]|nr:NAD(P)/FAD-dependent oxidoreductase [Candidatus Riflebacteria bacterium]
MLNIVIIGAGPAGLTSAYELLKNNPDKYNVTIVEAENKIGGLSATIHYGKNQYDIGPHRFFSKDDSVMQLWNEVLPFQGYPSFDDKMLGNEKNLYANGANPEESDEVMLLRNRISRIFYKKSFFDYPVKMNYNTIVNLGLLTMLRAGFSYLYSSVHKLPENSLEDFYINRFGKVLYSIFFEGYTEKLWGRHPRDISAEWGAQRVKGLSIYAVLKDCFKKILGRKNNKNSETSLIEEFWYPKLGSGQYWETLAKKIKENNGRILLGHEVKQIKTEGNKFTSVICNTSDGEVEIKGDYFISSMPIKDLIAGINDVNDNVKRIASGLPYRDLVAIGLSMKKLNIKNTTNVRTLGNIVPDSWIYIQYPDVKIGRVSIFNNFSPYIIENSVDVVSLCVEYFCSEGDSFWNLDSKDCIEFAIKELEKIGIISKENVLDSHVEKVKKAYPAYFDTYSEFDTVKSYLNEFENLLCVGRNGQHKYNNMDHSMLTGIKAAESIISNSLNKTELWNVNTEKVYHEEKTNN